MDGAKDKDMDEISFVDSDFRISHFKRFPRQELLVKVILIISCKSTSFYLIDTPNVGNKTIIGFPM